MIGCRYPKQKRMSKRLLATLFVVAFLAAFLHALTPRVYSVANLFDSGSYFNSSAYTLLYWQSLLTGHGFDQVNRSKLVEQILTDGPVLPAIGGFVYLVSGLKPDLLDFKPLLFMQALIHAATALALVFAARPLLGIRAAYLSGFIWATYAPALAGASKFMSEPLACLLLTILIWSTAALPTISGAIISGLVITLIALTKPALLPGAAGAIALALAYLTVEAARGRVRLKHVIIALSLTVFAFAVSELPWLNFIHKQTGQYSLTFNRLATRNIIEGELKETDGWEARFSNPLAEMFSEREAALPSLIGLWSSDPPYYLNLLLRKVARLFANPWNDYRYTPLFIPLLLQVLWHRLLWIGAIVGVFFAIPRMDRRPADNTASGGISQAPQRERLTFLAIFVLTISHLIYLPFAACSRYAITAMPGIVIMAVYGLQCLLKLKVRGLPARIWQQTWATCTLNILLLSLLIAVAISTLISDPLNKEVAQNFGPTRPLKYSFKIDQADGNDGRVMLVLDGQNLINTKGTIELNGQDLDLKLKPLSTLNLGENQDQLYQLFARLRGLNPDQIRQWYCQNLPPELLTKDGAKNTLTLTPSQSMQIFAGQNSLTSANNWTTMPSLRDFSATLFTNNPLNQDPRPPVSYLVRQANKSPLRCYVLVAYPTSHPTKSSGLCDARMCLY